MFMDIVYVYVCVYCVYIYVYTLNIIQCSFPLFLHLDYNFTVIYAHLNVKCNKS